MKTVGNIHRTYALNFKIIGYFFLAVVYCSLSACATSGDVNLMNQDLYKLQRDSQMMKNEINVLKEKTTGMAREESLNVMRQNHADMQSQISTLSKDLQVLSGRFDENKYFIEKTMKSSTSETDLMKLQISALEGQIREIKNRLSALEMQIQQQKESLKEQPKENEKNSEESEKEAGSHTEQTVKSGASDKSAKYGSAYTAFKNKKFKDAREKFEAFVKEYPKDELSDNAHFWIAETYYNEKDYEAAILAYETFLKKYPKSKKGPSALLKQGLSFNEIGDKKTGKVILEQLAERYPDSKEAETAKKTLKDLEKKPPVKKK